MDISGGMPAVIMKMLVASEPGVIRLLPALPEVWPAGEIQGVSCRGQVTINSLQWNEDQVNLSLVSAIDQSITLQLFDKSRNVDLKAGETEDIGFAL